MNADDLLARLEPQTRNLLTRLAGLPALQGAFVVGGTVRDLLLGRPVRDVDLALPGDALAAGRQVARVLNGHFVSLSEERHVARVALDAGPIACVDLAALRGGIDDDLRARDFTIGAVALRLAGAGNVIDPLGGAADAGARRLRAVSPVVFDDDPLRLLRLARLAVELKLNADDATLDLARAKSSLLPLASPERRRDELVRVCATDDAHGGLRLMDALGLLETEFPEVCAGRGVVQPKEHYYDVFDHALETVRALDGLLGSDEPDASEGDSPGRKPLAPVWRALWDAFAFADLRAHLDDEPVAGRPRRALLKLAGLLHDVAKPQTRAPDATGRIRFFGHAELGAEAAQRIMRRLRFSGREAEYVATLVREHLRPLQLAAPGERPTRRALSRFFRDTGDASTGLLLLSLADHLAARGPKADERSWRAHVEYLAWVLRSRFEDETLVSPPRLVTGHDVMAELGLEPGPEVGRVLRAIEEAQASGEITTREEALALARAARDRRE